jgi:hypothetical protein
MPTQREVIRAASLADTLFATRYFFYEQYGHPFNVGDHHKLIAEKLDRVYAGKCKRLIINMPPRYSKTEMAVKTFIAKGLAINPKAKFIHLSYSGSLALENSEQTKEMVTSDWYRQLFPEVQLRKEAKSKQKWYTTEGGGVYATSSAGQVTGFGAGIVETKEGQNYHEEEERDEEVNVDDLEEFMPDQDEEEPLFGGAIIIDDPLKPDDADSAVTREKVNNRFETTIRSRTNSRNTPIIVIMQRLHQRDLAGYLMDLEPDEWEVLSLKAINKDENGNEYALYPFKQTLEELIKLRKKNPYVFDAQYQQDPKGIGSKRWLFAFERKRHTGHVEYDPTLWLYASFDFNRNPMTCTLFQITDEGQVRGIDCIRLEDATTRETCQEIDRRYPGAFLIITGDASGKNLTTVSKIDNYTIIKNYFNLGDAQMQYHAKNPRLQDSRYFMNSLFEQYDIIYDEDRCALAIYDFENVQSDQENKPKKIDREDESQQADFLDNNRYFFHKFYKEMREIE